MTKTICNYPNISEEDREKTKKEWENAVHVMQWVEKRRANDNTRQD